MENKQQKEINKDKFSYLRRQTKLINYKPDWSNKKNKITNTKVKEGLSLQIQQILKGKEYYKNFMPTTLTTQKSFK